MNPNKHWKQYNDRERKAVEDAFEGRACIFTDKVGTQDDIINMSKIYSQVIDRSERDPAFVRLLDPHMVTVVFGAGSLAGVAAPGGWAGQLNAYPHEVAPVPLNGSDFMFTFPSREDASLFYGWVIGLGYHGWLSSYHNQRYV